MDTARTNKSKSENSDLDNSLDYDDIFRAFLSVPVVYEWPLDIMEKDERLLLYILHIVRMILLVFLLDVICSVDMYIFAEWNPVLRIEYEKHLDKIGQNGAIVLAHQVRKMSSV